MEKLICSECGTLDKQHTVTKGSFIIEVVLWLCFIVPGIIYSLWRINSRHSACSKCNSVRLVPIDTPAGIELCARFGHKSTLVEEKRRTSKAAVSVGNRLGKLVGMMMRGKA